MDTFYYMFEYHLSFLLLFFPLLCMTNSMYSLLYLHIYMNTLFGFKVFLTHKVSGRVDFLCSMGEAVNKISESVLSKTTCNFD